MFIWLCTRLDRLLIFNEVLLKLAQHCLFGFPWADEFALWLQELKWDSGCHVVRAWVELHCFCSGLPLFWDIRATARESGLDRDFLVVRMLLRFLLLFCMVGLHISVTSVRLGSHEAFIGLSSHFRKPRNL